MTDTATHWTAEKHDFTMTTKGEPGPVKARIFKNYLDKVAVQISGGIFNGYEVNPDELDEAIAILQSVRAAAERVRQDS